MFKKSVLLGLSTLLVSSTLFVPKMTVGAEELQVEANQEVQEVQAIQPQTRAFIATARGELKGSIVPFYDKKESIAGLQTGYVDLYYHSSSTGFVDGKNAYLTIELPQEFATIAKQAQFKESISGRVQRKGLFGDEWFAYSQEDIQVSGNQITLKTPRELWIFNGEVNANISIDYGKVQGNFPIRLIQDNPAGYEFKAALRRSMAPWDPFQYPLIGSNSSTWSSTYSSAYWE